MKGKLRNGEFFIGNRVLINPPECDVVTIVDQEIHYVFGKRYKILGRKEWFEENCFEYVIET
jgi:hypothetical protein